MNGRELQADIYAGQKVDGLPQTRAATGNGRHSGQGWLSGYKGLDKSGL